jgi:hypothetical protein
MIPPITEVDVDNQPVYDKEIYMELLRRLADTLAIRFFCPVYLVGSFITKGFEALDIDIIMVMSEDRIMRLFRSKECNDRKLRFIKKQKAAFEDVLKDYDIDFKVQSEDSFNKRTGPRVRLDYSIEVMGE